MKMKFKDENEFESQVIKDLERNDITVINLHHGVFDAYVDSKKKGFLEFKLSKVDLHMYHRYMIKLTENQTTELRKLSRKPIILACNPDKGKFHFLSPQTVNKLSRDPNRINRKCIWLSERYFPNPAGLSYKRMMTKLLSYLER